MATSSPSGAAAAGGGVLPERFRFGVATAGFQIEGGYNGPGEPRNNWGGWEAEGRVEPSGTAVDFWHRYEEHLDRAAGLGCDSFRMSVEWARAEPEEGRVDREALGHYHRIVEACHDRGLAPLVTLHHFTHPGWLGEEFWLRPDAPERFVDWVSLAVDHLGDVCSDWITTNECNILATESWLIGSFPPGRIGAAGAAVCALDHLLTGHVLAYDLIHARQERATVATNNYSLSLYELDQLQLDLLTARSHGVERRALPGWLADRKSDHERSIGLPKGPARLVESVLRATAARNIPLDQAFPRATAAVYGSPHDRQLDVVQLDYYAPRATAHLAAPGRQTAGGRTWSPGSLLWDDRPDPDGLTACIERSVEPGLDVWVVENGMCNRVRRGRSYPRLDGWDRARYLRANLAAVVAAADRGAPVAGYWHWTLTDNYEWGSYEPRFGLFGVDRERGIAVSETDAMGDDAAGAYRALITGLRSGDRSVLGDR